jgi:nucleoid DNA-binding protein
VKTTKWTASSFATLLHEELEKAANGARRTGTAIKIKKADVRHAVESVFEHAAHAGANGQRVRFPVIGALAWREVKARRAGMGKNPFTGESIMLKARPASRKPRWSFPKAVREAYARSARKAA